MPVSVRGKLNVQLRTLRGNSLDDWWSVVVDDDEADAIPLEFRRSIDAPPIRYHHEIHCGAKYCRNRVPAPGAALQFVFMTTTFAVRQASKPGLREWVYELAKLATADLERGTVTYTFDALRAALTYNNTKFARHTRQ
jgi:hypothetical protein